MVEKRSVSVELHSGEGVQETLKLVLIALGIFGSSVKRAILATAWRFEWTKTDYAQFRRPIRLIRSFWSELVGSPFSLGLMCRRRGRTPDGRNPDGKSKYSTTILVFGRSSYYSFRVKNAGRESGLDHLGCGLSPNVSVGACNAEELWITRSPLASHAPYSLK